MRNSSNVNKLKYEETDINIRVIVNNSAPSIGEVHIEDDLDDAGIQIIPNVDANREIKFNVSFEDPDVDDFDRMSITFRGHNVSFNKTQGIIALESTDEAGNYSLEITVYDKSNVSASKTLLIEYKELSAVVLDTRSISLSASEGGNITLEGDKDLNTFDKPTIKNVGNTKLNLGAISSGTETLPFASIEFSIAGVKKALNTDLNVVNTALKPGQMTGLNLYLNQGINLKKGTYSGKVIIVGIPA